MAVSLQAKAKATILAPAWMDADALEEVLRKERESEADFQARTRRWALPLAGEARAC